VNGGERLLIVGGGPGGLATARAYREAGGGAAVTILTAEEYPPYRRPPLTKEFLRGEMPRPELFMQEEGWYRENGISLETSTTATALDLARRTVETPNGTYAYHGCVLATGSEPVRIPVPGADDPGIGVMRTIADSERLRRAMKAGTRVAVVGSGFIGCEAAASLALRGARVTLLTQEEAPQAARLGPDVAERIRRWLENYGVGLRFGVDVTSIERGEVGYRVSTGDGDVEAEGVLFGTGVRPRTGLAEEAGLSMESGGVATDASMRTSDPSVFAVGDVAAAMNASAGARQRVEHWGDALNHGTVAGTVLAGGEAVWDMAPGFWSTIGDRSLKYWSWSGGWDEARFVDHGSGDEDSFTVWYGREGVCVGVLAHNADDDYERGRGIVERGEALPS
jgi:3-phenylpropionate/trans-cinnamate dioxygenase ferredoxin reductase component